MTGPAGSFLPPPRWLAVQLAVAPWLFWTCPPCWVMALLSPAGGAGGEERAGRTAAG